MKRRDRVFQVFAYHIDIINQYVRRVSPVTQKLVEAFGPSSMTYMDVHEELGKFAFKNPTDYFMRKLLQQLPFPLSITPIAHEVLTHDSAIRRLHDEPDWVIGRG